jgi:amidohydrolase
VSITKGYIEELTLQVLPEIIRVRHHLHQHPELSFKEYKTAEFIRTFLNEHDISFTDGYVETGIVASIKGELPGNGTFMLRADIDALPIQEENQVPYASRHEGVMHACGHDVHTANVLGALLIIKESKHLFGGTIKAIFQPGEEVLPGGAKLMIEAGALGSPLPDSILGQHVYPDLPAGTVGFRPGAYMASADELHITVKGKGGHAALPDRLKDPVLMAAHLIVALQQVVSRQNNPKMPSVLSIGKVEAKGATNVIPNEVKLEGTFRTFDEEWRFEAHKNMKALASGLVEGMGGKVDFDLRVGYPSVFNHPELTDRMKACAINYLGEENVIDLDMRMTAEDFSYYTHHLPGCFYRLGTAASDGSYKGLHTSTFDIDENALKTGVGLMAFLALTEINTVK